MNARTLALVISLFWTAQSNAQLPDFSTQLGYRQFLYRTPSTIDVADIDNKNMFVVTSHLKGEIKFETPWTIERYDKRTLERKDSLVLKRLKLRDRGQKCDVEQILAIDKKLAVDDQLFFVAMANNAVVGTVMAGYDGHRGWIYSMAVSPSCRRQGIGSRLVAHAERALISKGCVKINLQIMEGNERVMEFYSSLGFTVERRISMGKPIRENVPVA